MTAPDARWAETARDLQFTHLGDIRATAGNWRNALVGLTGLLTAVTIVKGTGTAGDLSHAGLVWTASLAGATLFLLVVGSLLAGMAAYGLPERDKVVTGELLKAWTRKQAVLARKQLGWSIVCFVVSIVTLAAAIGVTWFDPGHESPSVVVDVNGGAAACGAVKSIGTKTIIVAQKDAYGHTYDRTIRLSRVAGVAAAAGC